MGTHATELRLHGNQYPINTTRIPAALLQLSSSIGCELRHGVRAVIAVRDIASPCRVLMRGVVHSAQSTRTLQHTIWATF